MTRAIMSLMAATLLSPAPRSKAPDRIYSEVYEIIIKGERAGVETVTENLDKSGNIVSSSLSEILVSDGLETKRMAFSTEMTLSKNELVPIRYSYRHIAGQSKDGYDVTVKDGQIRRVLSRGGRLSEVSVPLQPGVVILDFNVYHQYDFLARKYDLKKGGRQSFHNFVPLIGGEIPLALTLLEDSTLQSPTGGIPVRNFKIEFVGIWTGAFAMSKEGRLVRLVIREQDLEVLRKDLLPESTPSVQPKPSGPAPTPPNPEAKP